jgi:hypothetical protein
MSLNAVEFILEICKLLVTADVLINDVVALIGSKFEDLGYGELRVQPDNALFEAVMVRRKAPDSDTPHTLTLSPLHKHKLTLGDLQVVLGEPQRITPLSLLELPKVAYEFDNDDAFTCTLFTSYEPEDGAPDHNTPVVEIMIRRDRRF